METPVFRLEGVVKARDEMADFEGPLVLILQLLSKDKVEIRDISISLILEQYLTYLETMAELDLDVASEFVTMASHLAYIKSKMLLSSGEEISELEQLISSLEQIRRGDLYLQIKSAADALSGMHFRYGVMMAGPPEYTPPVTEYTYIHESADLLEAICQVIGRENSLLSSLNPREPVYPRRIAFSIPEKISEILDRLRQIRSLPAAELFYGSGSRSELIATLIAVLELCRVGSVTLTGDQDEIIITYTGVAREPASVDFTAENY